jgi:hypothetical protein
MTEVRPTKRLRRTRYCRITTPLIYSLDDRFSHLKYDQVQMEN